MRVNEEAEKEEAQEEEEEEEEEVLAKLINSNEHKQDISC